MPTILLDRDTLVLLENTPSTQNNGTSSSDEKVKFSLTRRVIEPAQAESIFCDWLSKNLEHRSGSLSDKDKPIPLSLT